MVLSLLVKETSSQVFLDHLIVQVFKEAVLWSLVHDTYLRVSSDLIAYGIFLPTQNGLHKKQLIRTKEN
jgi:hypothetical protein